MGEGVCVGGWGVGGRGDVEVCGCAEIHIERTLGHRGGGRGCVRMCGVEVSGGVRYVWKCVLVCMGRWLVRRWVVVW